MALMGHHETFKLRQEDETFIATKKRKHPTLLTKYSLLEKKHKFCPVYKPGNGNSFTHVSLIMMSIEEL